MYEFGLLLAKGYEAKEEKKEQNNKFENMFAVMYKNMN